MATKIEKQVVKKQKLSLTDCFHLDGSDRFSNLNQNYKCPDNASSLVQYLSKPNSCKKTGYKVTNNYHNKEKSWNKTTLSLNPLKHFNLIEEDYEEKIVKKRRWMNDKDSTNKKNSSTLSLHIAAYENFIETFSNEYRVLPKKTKAFKLLVPLSKSKVYQDLFEIPRQMEDDNSMTPEVQQFTASQRLFSPHQAVSKTVKITSNSEFRNKGRMEENKSCEDMIFFERRLTEVISSMKPKTYKWFAYLGVFFCAIIYSTYFLILDPNVRYVPIWESLCKHPTFAASIISFFGLFFIGGIHRKLMAHKIIAARCRTVLADFCLSCDEGGKLIVRPANVPNMPFGTSSPSDRNMSFA